MIDNLFSLKVVSLGYETPRNEHLFAVRSEQVREGYTLQLLRDKNHQTDVLVLLLVNLFKHS